MDSFSRLIDVYSLSANLSETLRLWVDGFGVADESLELELILSVLGDSMDLLVEASSTPPLSAITALKRCNKHAEDVISILESPAKKTRYKLADSLLQSSELRRQQTEIAKMKDMVIFFRDIVSQFYNRVQLDRTLDMQQKLLLMQQRLPEVMQNHYARDDDDHASQLEKSPESSENSGQDDNKGNAQTRNNMADNGLSLSNATSSNAGFPRFLFRGGIYSPPRDSGRGNWTGIQGAYDTQSEVNLVAERTVKRCGLEDHIVEIEPVTLQSREDQQWQLNKQICLVWAPNNSTRTYETVFLVDPASLSDLLLGTAFSRLEHVMNNNRSFMTIKIGTSDPASRLAESQEKAEKLTDDQKLSASRKAAREAKRKADQSQNLTQSSTQTSTQNSS